MWELDLNHIDRILDFGYDLWKYVGVCIREGRIVRDELQNDIGWKTNIKWYLINQGYLIQSQGW